MAAFPRKRRIAILGAGLLCTVVLLELAAPGRTVLLVLLPLLVVAAVATGWTAASAFGAEQAQRGSHYELLAHSFPGGALLMFDRRLRHMVAAGRGLGDLGLAPDAIRGRALREVLSPELSAVLEPLYRDALEGHECVLEFPYGERDLLMRVVPLHDEAGVISAGLLTTQDVTDLKWREYRLSALASRDSLTGLWNRRKLSAELEQLLGQPRRRSDRPGSILLIDLNGFKQVNDTLGHEAGDQLLRRVARAIESSVRRTDLVARLGGDEFAVLLPGTGPDEASRIAGQIGAAVRGVWPLGLTGGASVGVAGVGGGNRTVAEALASADRAMYAAKRPVAARVDDRRALA